MHPSNIKKDETEDATSSRDIGAHAQTSALHRL
jgi:hypothetical protein